MALRPEHLDDPITRHAQPAATVIMEGRTVGAALEHIRRHPPAEPIVYFYVTDAAGRLTGVLPTRRLLTAPLEQPVTEVMDRQVVAIPDRFTVLEACELFVMHRYLAFPVVDAERRLLGVADVQLFADEIFDLTEREHLNSVFEWLGLRLAQFRDASFARRFRARFLWLLATLAGGTVCALLAGLFAATLQARVALALFLTLALGLGESVCVQSLSLAVHQLGGRDGGGRDSGARELGVAAALALTFAALTAAFSWLWLREPRVSWALLLGITASVSLAALIGWTVPAVLHRLKLDLKIAAGPIALALADIGTIVCYLGFAALLG